MIEVLFMLEKHIRRLMVSCIGMGGMRRLVIAILALTVLSGFALAHTPAGVAVSFNESSGDLGVTIKHQVDDPATHYIKRVTVRQGTTILVDKSYTSQPEKSDFSYVYPLPQLKGSSGEIRADVECNIFGSRSGTLSLAGTTGADPPMGATPAPTKAPGCIFGALVATGLAAMRRMR
jgi:hypothetical protein